MRCGAWYHSLAKSRGVLRIGHKVNKSCALHLKRCSTIEIYWRLLICPSAGMAVGLGALPFGMLASSWLLASILSKTWFGWMDGGLILFFCFEVEHGCLNSLDKSFWEISPQSALWRFSIKYTAGLFGTVPFWSGAIACGWFVLALEWHGSDDRRCYFDSSTVLKLAAADCLAVGYEQEASWAVLTSTLPT